MIGRMTLEFVKMEGLGNDFVVFEGPLEPTEADIRWWCDRRRGVGADGVLVATPLGVDRVRMEYWNTDGSRSEMCGNGLRCVAVYATSAGWVGEQFTVETDVGDYAVRRVEDGVVDAFLGKIQETDQDEIAVGTSKLRRVDLGNPHAVVMVDDIDAAPVATSGPEIENHSMFPDRTNVEFVEVVDEHRIKVRTWERGVGETLACGTGAGAAAAIAQSAAGVRDALSVELLGGELALRIDGPDIWMVGPARVVFRGNISSS